MIESGKFSYFDFVSWETTYTITSCQEKGILNCKDMVEVLGGKLACNQ